MAREKQHISENFGLKLRDLRASQNLTQRMLAEKTHISYVQINKYEKGQALPKPIAIKKLAKALGVDESILIEEIKNSLTSIQGRTSQDFDRMKDLDTDLYMALKEFYEYLILKQRIRNQLQPTE